MATFVIETYLSRARASELDAETSRLRDAIAALTIDPTVPEPPVRWLLSYFVPDDEMCVHVVEAASAAVVAGVTEVEAQLASRAQGLSRRHVADRLVEVTPG